MNKWHTSVKCVGDKILVRGYYDGLPYQDVIDYQPTIYLKSKEPTEFKSLENEYLKPVNPGTIRDTRKFLEKYKDVDGFKLYGNESPVYQFIADEFPEKIQFQMDKHKIYYLDIETTSEHGGVDVEGAREQILLITIMDYATKKSITFGSRPYTKLIENNTYVECKNESELLERFLKFWENSYADAVSGWNIETFDIPYLVKRIEKSLGNNQAKRLSPWKIVRSKNIIDRRTEKTYETYEIYGVNVLDYLPYFKKYAGIGVENNKLDTVAKEVLKETKLDHTEYETFAEFYTKDWDLFVEYNIVDTQLIDKLENKLRLLQLAFTLAMDSKVNPEDTLSQGRMWDAIIYNHLLAKGVIIPTKSPSEEKTEKYKGAFVKPPQIGKFKWVASFDVSSLYPSLIRTFNISPETLIQERNESVSIDSIVDHSFIPFSEHSDYCICANGSMYRRDTQGFLPKIMEEMFDERSVYKKKMIQYQKDYELNPSKELEELVATYRILQESKKQCLNSAYGSLGNSYFRFYDIRNAEAITYMGQAVIKTVEKHLNAYLQKVTGQDIDMILAEDTDSTFLNLESVVDKVFKDKNPTEQEIIDFLCSICDNQIQKVIDSIFAQFSKTTNAFQNCLHMKREKICSSALWKAKKNYILYVWDNEGVRYSEPKIKISGIEAVKSSTPAVCRSKIRTAIEYIMSSTEDKLIDFIQEFKEEFFTLPPEDVSFPRRVSDIDKWFSKSTTYIKGTPIQARASILYNKYIKEKNLDNKYPLIKNGENLKFCYLRTPNPIREDVIGFVQRFPKELNLEQYVDYNTQFNLTFIQPLTKILDVIGWKTEKHATLDDLF
jgi:DNA polymerase elongation subunit (family B)